MPHQPSLPLAGLPNPPERKAKTRQRTAEQAWLDWASAEWAAYHRAPMTVRWARDLALIKPLLRLHGEEELKLRWRGFLSTMDEYFARRGWDVPSFSTAIDRYRGELDLVPLVRRRHIRARLQDEEIASRDPLTGADLRTNRRHW
jgi:hypothetical protein